MLFFSSFFSFFVVVISGFGSLRDKRCHCWSCLGNMAWLVVHVVIQTTYLAAERAWFASKGS